MIFIIFTVFCVSYFVCHNDKVALKPAFSPHENNKQDGIVDYGTPTENVLVWFYFASTSITLLISWNDMNVDCISQMFVDKLVK